MPDAVVAATYGRRMTDAPVGTLYALDTLNGLVKLGFTSRPLWQRVAQYPPMFTVIASTPGTKADERDLHRALKPARAMGREWYYVSPEVVRTINAWITIANDAAAQRLADDPPLRPQRPGRSQPQPVVVPMTLPAFVVQQHHVTSDPRITVGPRSRSGGHRAW